TAGALWSGASSTSDSSFRISASSIGVGSEMPPPWTTRCPTASTPTASSNIAIGRSRSASSTTLSLRLVEPALTQRTSVRTRPSVRPGPVADLRVVVPVCARVRAGGEAPLLHLLPQVGGAVGEARHPVDDVDHEVE